MYSFKNALTLLLILLPIPASSQWLQFGAGCPEGSEPRAVHNITLDDLITFDVELQGLLADTILNDSISYLRFDGSPGTTPMDSVGYPELPTVVCFVAVPDDADLELSCLSELPETMALDIDVYPAPLDSLFADSTTTPYIEEFFVKDSSAYFSEEWYPDQLAEIVGDFHLRDQRVAIVSVHPVQYLASEDSLRVWTDLELSIVLDGEELDWNEDGLGYYDLLIEDLLLGYDPDYQPIDNEIPHVVRHASTTSEPSIDPDYVILVANGLDGAWIDSFANYRAVLNKFDVLITDLDDVMIGYAGSSTYPTPDIIRDYLEALWDWSPPEERPTYLLLIGDHEDPPEGSGYPDWFLPSRTIPDACNTPWAPFEAANDDWFVYFDESRDIFSMLPDMIVGRLSARTDGELQPMLDLIVEFEEPFGQSSPGWMARRRELLRMSGQCDKAPDPWNPSEAWLTDFADWMDYGCDSYYCGDGENTVSEDPSNIDGSSMTSEEWVDDLAEEYEDGFQLGFYTDHGCEHFLSAGLNWDAGGPPNFGIPDSCFDGFDAEDSLEVPQDGHLPPFLLMLCCSAGTFNHTMVQHLFYDTQGYKHKCYCFFEGDSLHPSYDFGTDCLAETFMKNTECGTIGVFASSNPSYTGRYQTIGSNIMEGLYYLGLTRIGDAVCYYRLQSASSYVGYDGMFSREFARFNLLGDPAVDIGDRMKYPNNCDIIISPDDLALMEYPTCSIDGSGDVLFYVMVRNAGGSAAGAFDVDLIVQDSLYSDTVTVRCPGLEAGQQRTLEFPWRDHSWFSPPGTLCFTAGADDPGGQHPDSWTGNNGAEVEVFVEDFYPNDDGWPVRTPGSIYAPPILANLDEDDDLEIVVVSGQFLCAYDPDDPSEPIWMSGPYSYALSEVIPAAGDIDDDGTSEIVMAVRDGLIILDGSDGEAVDEESYYEYNRSVGSHPNSVTLADVFYGSNGLEIAAIYRSRSNSDPALHILGLDSGSIVELDSEDLPTPIPPTYYPGWIVAFDGTPDASDELCITYSWHNANGYHSGLWIYDHDDSTSTSGFTDSETWEEDQHIEGIPAIGTLPSEALTIALSRLKNFDDPHQVNDIHPAWLLDPDDLTGHDECAVSVDSSDHILCCVMADWESPFGQADRVLANAENQRFGWYQNGFAIQGYPGTYSTTDHFHPPFPALGNLDSLGVADFLVACRTGIVMGYDNQGYLLSSLDFPYILPNQVPGGFVIADIDKDEKVEVVFGTVDNYLHVWELGGCEEGYAPWLQCQHDAGRTGMLLEE